VAYSSLSPRWVFPSFWYNFTKVFDGGVTVEFVGIDTVTIAGLPEADDHNGQPFGPLDVESAAQELQWIQQTLEASTADYLLVYGHYPVWSPCSHGPTSALVSQLLPILNSTRVSMYLAGHDHVRTFFQTGGQSWGRGGKLFFPVPFIAAVPVLRGHV